ncbi:ProQ/FinO family protein [Methylotenera mobilis]|uniref:ProQ/FinO family protein n=1 Tax=Methylotenera mobilis TaxID=359408 RepID=UPI000372A784|nr:ProQ/FinO family protein [Methylotenera mobilis]
MHRRNYLLENSPQEKQPVDIIAMGLEQLAALKKQLAEEKKSEQSANKAKTKNTNPVDPVVLIIGKLQRLYPKAFPKNPTPKVPLKIGILENLQLQSEEIGISKEDLQLAIKTWCKSSRYWQACKEGATRLDLDGNPAGIVEATGAAHAKEMVRKRTKAKQSQSE